MASHYCLGVSASENSTLSEAKSKKLLANFGFNFAIEQEVFDADQVAQVASEVGFPVAIKLCADTISHKTERGLVKLNVNSFAEAQIAVAELKAGVRSDDGQTSFLVAKMETGKRELILGLVNDPQFGPFVMFGSGGVFAEVLDDVTFASVPLTVARAHQLIERFANQKILKEFRGDRKVDREQLAAMLVSLSDAFLSNDKIKSIDVNPVIIRQDGSLVAVDALIELASGSSHQSKLVQSQKFSPSKRHFQSLFEPRGVVVVGASTHPGKFGFVSLHNILANEFGGEVAATHLEGESVLNVSCRQSIEELSSDKIDLAFVCTPASTNAAILQSCAKKEIHAVYVTSAGYAESDSQGEQAQAALAKMAGELDILLVGPNGQGVISTPTNLCAQIVGPYPPSGSISLVSQSGNFVSSFMNYSRQTNVGIARAVSAGNAAQVGVSEFLTFYAHDDKTRVALAYIEGVKDGTSMAKSMLEVSVNKPLVVVKGGSTQSGSRAATSHTGALASDHKIFEAVCFDTGTILVDDVERAFDVAATFATQPLPRGKNTIVLTTIGGWGVVTADVIHNEQVLNLMELPIDLEKQVSALLPSRWSKNNPIDCAGGETRDTVAEILTLLAKDERVDAIIFLGLGIQSNQARMMREGNFFPDFELDRIVNYHERQDISYANISAELSNRYDKPILVATELAMADQDNPGVVAVRHTGRLCYASGQRAARALSSVYRYAKWSGAAN